METIPKAECTEIGFFRKTHGVSGEMVLEFDQKYEQSVEEATRFFVMLEGLLVPFFIAENGLRFKSEKSVIVGFDYVESEKYAKRLIGKPVFLFTHEIIDDPEVSFKSQLIDFLLFEKDLGKIGIIKEVDDFSGNIVLTVEHNKEEILIPFNDDFVVKINPENKEITLNLPEGLIEIS